MLTFSPISKGTNIGRRDEPKCWSQSRNVKTKLVTTVLDGTDQGQLLPRGICTLLIIQPENSASLALGLLPVRKLKRYCVSSINPNPSALREEPCSWYVIASCSAVLLPTPDNYLVLLGSLLSTVCN